MKLEKLSYSKSLNLRDARTMLRMILYDCVVSCSLVQIEHTG